MLKNHTQTKHKDWKKAIKPTPIEELLLKFEFDETGKVIKEFYQLFLDMCPNNSLYIKERWEAEMGIDISPDKWEETCSEAHLVTNSNTWREFKWKVITRFFRTPVIVAKMGPTHSNRCWRECGAHIGNHTHIFWNCPKLRLFWRRISEALTEVFGQNFTEDPMVMLLGVVPEGIEGRAKTYLLHILLTAAIKCITIKWLKPDPPTYNMWVDKVWEIHQMEQITYALRLRSDLFIARWNPVMPILIQ